MAELIEDILAPIVRYLRSSPDIQSLHTLVPPNGTNPVLGPPTTVLSEDDGPTAYRGDTGLWIFRGFNNTGVPHVNVEGTGSCAITLVHTSPWSRRARSNSVESPEIKVFYHCDVTRDSLLGAPIAYDARDKCLTLHKAVSKALHIKDIGSDPFLMMGPRPDGSHALKVISSSSGRSLFTQESVNGDGMVEGQATFEMEVFL